MSELPADLAAGTAHDPLVLDDSDESDNGLAGQGTSSVSLLPVEWRMASSPNLQVEGSTLTVADNRKTQTAPTETDSQEASEWQTVPPVPRQSGDRQATQATKSISSCDTTH